ncbi:hypothetical protein MBLNU13_g00122t1 [Cladosporium sp. NU13]
MTARVMDNALSKEYRMMTTPESIHDSAEEESDHAIAQMFGASWHASALQEPNIFQDLVECAIRGSGRCPSRLKFFKNLISLPALQYLVFHGSEGGCEDAISDLEVSVPSTRLRKLTLKDCKLLTSEASSIVQCCPELVMLDMSWNPGFGNRHIQSSEQVQSLQFGKIADAIAANTPRLTSLRLSATHWPRHRSSLAYPDTIGTSLQRLKHLKVLTLDNSMIYGMQHLEELSFEHPGRQISIDTCTLEHAIPKAIESLTIEASGFIRMPDGRTEHVDE